MKGLNCKVHYRWQYSSAWIECLMWRSSALRLHSTVSSNSTVRHLQTPMATLALGGQWWSLLVARLSLHSACSERFVFWFCNELTACVVMTLLFTQVKLLYVKPSWYWDGWPIATIQPWYVMYVISHSDQFGLLPSATHEMTADAKLQCCVTEKVFIGFVSHWLWIADSVIYQCVACSWASQLQSSKEYGHL